jgi:tetratricopeptide (TPR) repeat protein
VHEDNDIIQTKLGTCYYKCGYLDKAWVVFDKVQRFLLQFLSSWITNRPQLYRSDQSYIKDMDVFASLMRSQRNGQGIYKLSPLNYPHKTLKQLDLLDRVVQYLTDISVEWPETWVAHARYAEFKGEYDRALGFLDKV